MTQQEATRETRRVDNILPYGQFITLIQQMDSEIVDTNPHHVDPELGPVWVSRDGSYEVAVNVSLLEDPLHTVSMTYSARRKNKGGASENVHITKAGDLIEVTGEIGVDQLRKILNVQITPHMPTLEPLLGSALTFFNECLTHVKAV